MEAITMKKPNVVVQIKTKINASADKVWEILGQEFHKIAEWTSFVEESKKMTVSEIPESSFLPALSAPIPARHTLVKNGGRTSELVEVVTMYSDKKRALTFYGIGLPKFIDYAGDTQYVQEINEHECEVVFDVEVRLKGVFRLLKGIVKKRFAENFKKIQEDLKTYVERVAVSMTA